MKNVIDEKVKEIFEGEAIDLMSKCADVK